MNFLLSSKKETTPQCSVLKSHLLKSANPKSKSYLSKMFQKGTLHLQIVDLPSLRKTSIFVITSKRKGFQCQKYLSTIFPVHNEIWKLILRKERLRRCRERSQIPLSRSKEGFLFHISSGNLLKIIRFSQRTLKVQGAP